MGHGSVLPVAAMIALADDHPTTALVRAVTAELRTLPDLGALSVPDLSYAEHASPYGAIATADGPRIAFYPGEGDVRPQVERLGTMLAAGRRLRDLGPHLPWALEAVAHEVLHGLPAGADWTSLDPGGYSLEEGFASTVAWDLVPFLARRLYGARVDVRFLDVPAAYYGCMTYVRRASARATGGPWWGHAARSWRVRWAAAPAAARAVEFLRLGMAPGCAIPGS